MVLSRWGGITRSFGFINQVDNVNWPPKKDSKALYGGQFTLSTQLIKPNNLFVFYSPVQQCCLSLIIATVLPQQATPTDITNTTLTPEKLDDLALIEQRLENWFVKQSQSSVHFTGNVKKRFESLPVDQSHEEFGKLNIVKSAEGVITGLLHYARRNQEAF